MSHHCVTARRRPAAVAGRHAVCGVAAVAALAAVLGGACRPAATQADAGHIDFDLAHGLPVVPGARVVYGGTQDDIFTLELATARPAAGVAEWYRTQLPRIGWRGIEVTAPSGTGAIRLAAHRAGSWLLARFRSDGVETEVTFAKGVGPVPEAKTLLPDEGGAGAAAASQAASAPASAPTTARAPGADSGAVGAGQVTPTDLLETLLLPDSVRRVGQPTAHGQAAMAGISSDLAPPSAVTEVGRALKEGGWRIDEQGEGALPGTRELRASSGAVALRLTLVPAGRGAAGSITVGPAAAVLRAAPAKPARGAKGAPGARRP